MKSRSSRAHAPARPTCLLLAPLCLIPLGAAAIKRVVKSLEPFAFDRLYGAFPGQVVTTDAKRAVERSAARYLRMIGG